MLSSVAGITGLPLRKSSLMSARPYQNRLWQSKMIDLEYVFLLICSLKRFDVSVGANSLFVQHFMTARCLKCAVSARF